MRICVLPVSPECTRSPSPLREHSARVHGPRKGTQHRRTLSSCVAIPCSIPRGHSWPVLCAWGGHKQLRSRCKAGWRPSMRQCLLMRSKLPRTGGPILPRQEHQQRRWRQTQQRPNPARVLASTFTRRTIGVHCHALHAVCSGACVCTVIPRMPCALAPARNAGLRAVRPCTSQRPASACECAWPLTCLCAFRFRPGDFPPWPWLPPCGLAIPNSSAFALATWQARSDSGWPTTW